MSDSSVPRAAFLLGLAGLMPSVAMLAIMVAMPEMRATAARIGLAYGAVIASFIGGAWWGLAAARPGQDGLPRRLVLSVVPSLLAWSALLLPAATGLLMLACVFASLPPTDRRLQAEGLAPGWWTSLRHPLSFGMAGLHLVAAGIMMLGGAASAWVE